MTSRLYTRRRTWLLPTLALLAACSRGRDAVHVPLPEYAVDWRTIESARWGVRLSLPPDVAYVSGPSSQDCSLESPHQAFIEPDSSALTDDAVGLELSFSAEPFVGFGTHDGGFGWNRPTQWQPVAEPGWVVYGEGPSGAELIEGNGWIELGGEPIVKIFIDEEVCLDMMGVDSAAADSILNSDHRDLISCGSAHDSRPRWLAVARRPSDRCYVILQRTDGLPVGDIAATLRFVTDDGLIPPIDAEAAVPFTFPTRLGIVMRTGDWSRCLVIRNAAIRPGTRVSLIFGGRLDATSDLATVGEPLPSGCGVAPAGHSAATDRIRWYAYDMPLDLPWDEPLLAVVGDDFDRTALQSMIAEQSVVDDSVVFVVRSADASDATPLWTAAIEDVPPRRIPTGPNGYTLQYSEPPTAKLPVEWSARLGTVERNTHGAICMTIANPRLPLGAMVQIVVSDSPQRLVVAHVAWRPPGGCTPDAPPGTRGYGLMLPDTTGFAVGATGIGAVDPGAATVTAGRAEVDVDGDGVMEEFAAQTTSRETVYSVTSQGQSRPRWRMRRPGR